MKVHDFNKLSEPIDNDARRRARIEVHRAEAVAEIVAHNLAELRRARDPGRARSCARDDPAECALVIGHGPTSLLRRSLFLGPLGRLLGLWAPRGPVEGT
jgi:hypothetical protein